MVNRLASGRLYNLDGHLGVAQLLRVDAWTAAEELVVPRADIYELLAIEVADDGRDVGVPAAASPVAT